MASPDKYNYLPKAAELLKSADSRDPGARLKSYKNYLQAGLDALVKQFQKGTRINQLLKARSALLDHILISSWQQFQVNGHSALICMAAKNYSPIPILIFWCY